MKNKYRILVDNSVLEEYKNYKEMQTALINLVTKYSSWSSITIEKIDDLT